MVDKSIDDLSFYSIAHTIAEPLKKRGYIPSFDPKHTDLAIFVFWGTTTGAERGRFSEGLQSLQNAMQRTADVGLDAEAESQMTQAMMLQNLDNAQRDRNNFHNARILGYRDELERAWEIPWFSQFRDVISELELDRYFVVLKAYDYDTFVFKRQRKLMWEVRFSIPAHGNAFDQELAAMTKCASQYFGEDVKHLVREAVKAGKVEVGTPTVIKMPAK
jgi:hypothetical protein